MFSKLYRHACAPDNSAFLRCLLTQLSFIYEIVSFHVLAALSQLTAYSGSVIYLELCHLCYCKYLWGTIYLSVNQNSPQVVALKSNLVIYLFKSFWLYLLSQCKEDQESFFQAQRDFITINWEYDHVFLRRELETVSWVLPGCCRHKWDGGKKCSMLRLVLGHLPWIPHPLSSSKELKLAAWCQGPQ